MVSSIEMQMGDESAKYVEISKFLKGVFGPWRTAMGEGKYDMVTNKYSDKYRYVQTARRKVVGPDGVVKPLTVKKADRTVQRTILNERFWEIKGEEWGERETFVDSDGEVSVRVKVVDENGRELEIYTKGTKEGFYQKTSCGLEQTMKNPAKPLVAHAEKLVAAASALGLPTNLCHFEEELTGKITEGGRVVNRHYEITFNFNYNDEEYYTKTISHDSKYVLPGKD